MSETLAELTLRALQSQQRLNDALVDDVKILHDRIKKLEAYVELIEERRSSELKGKGNA